MSNFKIILISFVFVYKVNNNKNKLTESTDHVKSKWCSRVKWLQHKYMYSVS